MTLEGAIKLSETTDYIIYTMNSVTTGQYGVVVPNNINGTLKMLVDLHMKSSFDGVGSGVKTKEQLISEISGEYDKLKGKYADGMLVMPMVDEAMLQSAVMNNDKQKMFDEVKKIGAITSELYKKLTDSGVDKQKIDQKIIIVEKNADDEKFVVWLKEQMPNFVDGVKFSELGVVQEVVNPFANNNSLFGPAPEAPKVENVAPSVSTPSSGGGIFDNIAPVASVNPVVSPAPVEPVVPSAPVPPVSEPVASSNVDIFGIPTSVEGVNPNPTATNVASNPVVDNFATAVSMAPVTPSVEPAPVVEAPTPVQSASLEGTTTFNPISERMDNNVSSDGNVEAGETAKNSSKGFANLLILLVILVGVTIISIELGKFLYNTFGA